MGKGAFLCYEKHPRRACGGCSAWAELAAVLQSWRIWDVASAQVILRTSRAGASLGFAIENFWLLQGLDPELEAWLYSADWGAVGGDLT